MRVSRVDVSVRLIIMLLYKNVFDLFVISFSNLSSLFPFVRLEITNWMIINCLYYSYSYMTELHDDKGFRGIYIIYQSTYSFHANIVSSYFATLIENIS